MRRKRLYYEELPPEQNDPEIPGEGEPENNAIDRPAVSAVAERDGYEELMAAARKIERLRFRVSPDTQSRVSTIALIMSVVIIIGAVALFIIKSDVGRAVIGGILLAAIAGGIAAMTVTSVKAKKVWYCCYARDERGVFCMSVIDTDAVVYACGTAYRISGDSFYTLDERGFIDFLDGECCGIVSILNARREDVEVYDDGYFVKNRIGGGHTVFIEEGGITEISSEQPAYTDDIDAKTGERRVKLKRFFKTEPTSVFAWEVPAFVKQAFEDNGVPLPVPGEASDPDISA